MIILLSLSILVVFSYYVKEDLSFLDDKKKEHEKTGYEYDRGIYKKKNVRMKSGVENCVLETMQSEKSPTAHKLSFIEDNTLVSIVYYDIGDKEFNLKNLETLSFKQVKLK